MYLSERTRILKQTDVNSHPVMVGEGRVRSVYGEVSSREEFLERAIEICENAEKERDKMLAQALSEKESILSKIRQEREEIHRRAYQEGFQKGVEEGTEEGKTRARQEMLASQKDSIKQLVSIVSSARQSLGVLVKNHENELVELAISIAEKIILREIDRSEDVVFGIVKQVLQRANDRQEILLRLNPGDVDLVKQHQDDLTAEFDDIRTVHIEPDTRVSRGGCLLELPSGCIDGRIEQQLQQVRKSLMSKQS